MSLPPPLAADLDRWMLEVPADSGVSSSRLRLARNLAEPFPGLLDSEEKKELRGRLIEALAGLTSFRGASFLNLEELALHERAYLMERGILGEESLLSPEGRGLVLDEKGWCSVLVGGEDHLRIQCMRPGLDLETCYTSADSLEAEMEEVFDFAFSESFGYLTACPSNAGTGLRASVLLQLPALAMGEDFPRVLRGMGALGLAVRGAFGEGGGAPGGFIQLSNARCLGVAEQDLVEGLHEAARKLLSFEEKARDRALREAQSLLDDQVARARGQLEYAQIMGASEAIALLGTLRMGHLAGLADRPGLEALQKALTLVRPGHLQMLEGRPMGGQERGRCRAERIRGWLAS